MPTLETLNSLPEAEAQALLRRTCGSVRWVERMCAARPFADFETLLKKADDFWGEMEEADWREAFAAHPRIGDMDSLKKKFATTADWSSREQAGVRDAHADVLAGLAQGNRDYEARFGFIFIICASGLSAESMLAHLRKRLHNDLEDELRIAAGEQAKITRIRLEKLLKS